MKKKNRRKLAKEIAEAVVELLSGKTFEIQCKVGTEEAVRAIGILANAKLPISGNMLSSEGLGALRSISNALGDSYDDEYLGGIQG